MREKKTTPATNDAPELGPLEFESTGDEDLDAAIRRIDAALVKAAARAAAEPPRKKWASDDDPAWAPHAKTERPS